MKYHYQYVSRTTVRIELIAEDQKEIAQIERLATTSKDEKELLNLYTKGLNAYNFGATLTKTSFMNFPKVALCSYSIVKEPKRTIA